MPKFAVHLGFSNISYLFSDDSKSIYGNIPFSKASDLSNSDLESVKFQILKELKLPVLDTSLIVTSFLQNNFNDESMQVIYLDKDVYLSGQESGVSCLFEQDTSIEHLNSAIYESVKAVEREHKLAFDRELLLLNPGFSNTKLLFTGDKLLSENINAYDKFLIYSLIKSEGIYDIFVDQKNEYLLKKVLGEISTDYTHIGSLINYCSEVELLIDSELGTKQLIVVEKDSFFALELDPNIRTHIIAKTSQTRPHDFNVPQGSSTLVVDTRNKLSQEFLTNISQLDLVFNVLSDIGGLA